MTYQSAKRFIWKKVSYQIFLAVSRNTREPVLSKQLRIIGIWLNSQVQGIINTQPNVGSWNHMWEMAVNDWMVIIPIARCRSYWSYNNLIHGKVQQKKERKQKTDATKF